MPTASALLKSGDRLDQKTFHAFYEASAPDLWAELIGGTVYFRPSRTKMKRGSLAIHTVKWLGDYQMDTPGTEGLRKASVILGPDSEQQPDLCLLISPGLGGATATNEDEYLTGPPELIVQVSDESEFFDLTSRKSDLEKVGVREYVVVGVNTEHVSWFNTRRGKFKELAVDRDGIFRSKVFPGLWLDPAALFAMDWKRLSAVLGLGLASPEHAAFVEKLKK